MNNPVINELRALVCTDTRSQRELSRKTGVPQSAISHLAAGRGMDMTNAQLLARAFGRRIVFKLTRPRAKSAPAAPVEPPAENNL